MCRKFLKTCSISSCLMQREVQHQKTDAHRRPGAGEFNLCAYVTSFSLRLSPHAPVCWRMCQKSILEYRIYRPDSTIGSSGERSRWWSRLVCIDGKKTGGKQNRNPIRRVEKICQSISDMRTTHLISISLDLMSPIEFPINDICSSLTPDRLTLIHRNMGTDERSVCKNCGSTRCFLLRSRTDMPSILIWLIGDDFSALEMALNVFGASSRWIIQLQIFNVLSNLRMEEGANGKSFNGKYCSSCYHESVERAIKI